MQVKVLFKGIHADKESIPEKKVVNRISKIRSSSTLIKGEKTILVDSSHFQFKDDLINALKENEVGPDDVDFLINTHTHRDHISNNHLFKNATLVHHKGVWYPDGSIEAYKKVEDIQVPGIKLIPTYGHTSDSISIILESDNKTYVISGDAFKEDIIRKNIQIGYTKSSEYRNNVKNILEIADVIIPGHGDIIEGESLLELREIVQNWKLPKNKAPTAIASAFIKKDNKYLVVFEPKFNNTGIWRVPGGRIEFGEKAENTVVREMQEELGIKVKVNNFMGYGQDKVIVRKKLNASRLILYFECEIVEGEPSIDHDDKEASLMRRVTLDELKKLDPLEESIKDLLSKQEMSKT